MKKILLIVFVMLLIVSGCSEEVKQEEIEKHEGTMEELAELFVNDFVNKSIDSMIEDYHYTEQVEQALNRMVFVQVYSQIENDNGEFVEVGDKNNSTSQGNNIVTYRIHYSDGTIKLNIVFDNNNKIAGFNYVQEKEQIEYSEGIISKDVEFGSEQFPVKGTVVYPNEGSNFPVVILVPGSGPTDRDSTLYENTPLKDIALGLAEKGVATLRFDKRSLTHGSNLDANTFTPYDEYIEDVVFSYNFLKEDNRINSDEIYIAGHSQGGNLIPAFAKEVDANGYIILAGNVTPLHELTIYQLEYLYNLDGSLSDEEEQELNMYKQMRDNINSLNENSEYSPNQLMGISKDYWLFYKNYDPIEYAKDIDKKLLIINGSRDYQVPISEFELWKEELDGKENVDFKLYEGMNHLLFIGEGTPSPQEYMNAKNVTQELINDIYEWINKK